MKMQYRTMNKTGDKISVLGFGCMRFKTKGGKTALISGFDVAKAKKIVRHAIDNGVNYLDTAYPYHRGASESFLGEHVLTDGYREKVFVATKLPCFFINKTESIESIFKKQLSKLKLDYIDYYLLHSLDGGNWDKMVRFGVVDFMDRMKKEKKVRNVGFSFHGGYDDFERIIDAYDWDVVQVQYNIIDEDFQAGRRGIEYAGKKGIGVIVMEPLRGGALISEMPKEVKEIYDSAEMKKHPVDWAFSHVYDNPYVTTVLSGMNELEQVEQNLDIADRAKVSSLTDKEKAIIVKVREKYLSLLAVGCTGCEYCLPCPAKIDIPGSFKALNAHRLGKASAKLSYFAYSGLLTDDNEAHYTDACIDCGICEKNCPQNIAVRKEFDLVRKEIETPGLKRLFGFLRLFRKKPKEAI
jgi:uncharacterized protein